MYSVVQPNQYVALRLASDQVRVERVVPNTIIPLGRYGSLHANQILGRPFHLTFEILDGADGPGRLGLRIVPAAELHADALIEHTGILTGSSAGSPELGDGYDDVLPDVRSNRTISDDPTNQGLTMAEIEALKSDVNESAKEIIAKIASSHSTIDQKTAFSLAKYTSRKNRKYLKRFCILPLDVLTLVDWLMLERDFVKVLELRNEMIGLIGCWANIHYAQEVSANVRPSGQYLVVDDTGGLVVAAMAEKMGILYPESSSKLEVEDHLSNSVEDDPEIPKSPHKACRDTPAMSAQSNTITLIHSNSQPNLALLKYFSFDAGISPPSHPLHLHLKTLSWLQLLSPYSDPAYIEPEIIAPETLAAWKSSKRGAYYRKRRRWTRVKSVIDSTRQGGFDGLIVATLTSPISILNHTVPLLAGGAQVIVYSPIIEPLVELADLYSTARRTAFIDTTEDQRSVPSKDFPLNPTLLLTPSVQTAKLKRWQVLPGRTHPLMIGRGGAEGYVFVATRVLPAPGRVQARGVVGGKRRKVDRPSESCG